jgi:hypothetical protein
VCEWASGSSETHTLVLQAQKHPPLPHAERNYIEAIVERHPDTFYDSVGALPSAVQILASPHEGIGTGAMKVVDVLQSFWTN